MLCFYVFFFFKQKTAYEMSISDWSSDVCASDLKVRVEIKQTRGNMRRMALYWAILSTAAPILSNMIEGDPIDENMLHKILKDRRGLYREVILPSGEVWKDYESISFHKMPENERTEYVTWALATLSKWIGIPVETLRHEAEAA